MEHQQDTGFTLIELLVVIAIIGIFSAIVAASLNVTKNNGSDKGITTNLANLRAQAELYYTSNRSSYSGVCGSVGASDGTKTIQPQLLAAGRITGVSSVVTVLSSGGVYNAATCHESSGSWAAEVPLRGSTSAAPSMLCVDSTGKLKRTSVPMLANALACI